MRSLFRDPVVHFVVLGALLGTVLHLASGSSGKDGPTTIHLTADDVARLGAEWTARWNRPPTAQELDGLVRANVRERVLHREAQRLGLDRDDPVVRRALVQKLERITDDLIELGLSPSDQQLEEYLVDHAERYRPEPLITFAQVFVDTSGNAADGHARAETLAADLRSIGEAAVARAESYGDRLMVPNHLDNATPRRIAAQFGTEFADSVLALEPGGWRGPVRSGYGLHVVWVAARETFPVPTLDQVRERVRQDWIDETRRDVSERYYDELLERYEVFVEDVGYPTSTGPNSTGPSIGGPSGGGPSSGGPSSGAPSREDPLRRAGEGPGP